MVVVVDVVVGKKESSRATRHSYCVLRIVIDARYDPPQHNSQTHSMDETTAYIEREAANGICQVIPVARRYTDQDLQMLRAQTKHHLMHTPQTNPTAQPASICVSNDEALLCAEKAELPAVVVCAYLNGKHCR